MTTPHQSWRVAPPPSTTEPGYAEVHRQTAEGWTRVHATTLNHEGAPGLLGAEWLRTRYPEPACYQVRYFDRLGGTPLGFTEINVP